MSLTFGYLCDFRNPPPWQRDWADVYAETLDFAVWTESAGFDRVWVPEHHGATDGYIPSPLIALAAIAARTSRIRLGTGVALGPLYHPVRFAEDASVLDILSNGRLDLGLGIGYRRRETQGMGLDFTKRGARFDAFLDIVTRLWAGETVTCAGEHFTLTNSRITPARPVPLYIGGFADKALERAAQYGTGYFGNEEAVAAYQAKCQARGTAGRVFLQSIFFAVADDPAAAMDELAPYFHYVSGVYGEWMAEDQAVGVASNMEPMSLDRFKASGILQILSPGQAVDHFKAMQERVPVEHVMLMLPPGMAPERFKPYAELVAKKVAPAFA